MFLLNHLVTVFGTISVITKQPQFIFLGASLIEKTKKPSVKCKVNISEVHIGCVIIL